MDHSAPSPEPLFRIVNERGEPAGMPASYDTIVVAGQAMLEEDPDMALTIEQLGVDRRWRSSFVMGGIAEPSSS
jgi:hypothetical protein